MGKIILLNTPIGNLGDITSRVSDALRQGELFAVEDTRAFKDLLNHLGISVSGKRILSLHDQSDKTQVEKLVEMAVKEDLYVASEAGSPIISDPAYPLIVKAYERGVKIESYSGVSSPIMALELSGLPPLPFQFHGFLPRESGKRKKIFNEVGQGTHLFFEAPTRAEETLEEISGIYPDTMIVAVRELSKKFEHVYRFFGRDWAEAKKDINFKGEFVLLFHRAEAGHVMGNELREMAQEIVANKGGPKTLAKLLGAILDRPSKDIYTELNRQKRD